MRRRAALAGALAGGLCASMTGPGSADTVTVVALLDPASLSNGSNLQNDAIWTAKGESLAVLRNLSEGPAPSDDARPGAAGVPPLILNEVAEDGSEKAGDSPGPGAASPREATELEDNSPDAVSALADPEPSFLTRLLMLFAELRVTIFGRP